MFRAVALCVVIALAAAATATTATVGNATHVAAPPEVVPCSDIIGHAKTGTDSGYRVVLGIVSVPPAHFSGGVTTHSTPWAYWRKAGLVIHASRSPVSVTIPNAWRTRAAITWGQSDTVSALRIAACPTPPKRWNAYAGGFYTRTPSECVPLTFKVGRRTQTVRFGIGRSCAVG